MKQLLIITIFTLLSSLSFAQSPEDSSKLLPYQGSTPGQRFLLDAGSTETIANPSLAKTTKFCPPNYSISGSASLKDAPRARGICAFDGVINIDPNGPCFEITNPVPGWPTGTYCSYKTKIGYASAGCDDRDISIYWEIWCVPNS